MLRGRRALPHKPWRPRRAFPPSWPSRPENDAIDVHRGRIRRAASRRPARRSSRACGWSLRPLHQSALLRLEHDMRDPLPVSGKRALQIVLPILSRHQQPHQESTEAVERLNRQLASAAAARRQPDVVTISLLVVIIEGNCEGWRVRQKPIEKMNWKVARQTAVAEQASSELVAFGLLQEREITTP